MEHLPANAHIRLKGEYMLVLNEGTDRESRTDWVPNLITDSGLDAIGEMRNFLGWVSVGTGVTTPSFSDTSLDGVTAAVLARPDSMSVTDNLPTSYTKHAVTKGEFPQGAVVGNISELGMGWSDGGVDLFSRALLVDSNNSPTTISVTAIDQLTVYYKIHCQLPVGDLTGAVTIANVTHSYIGRVADAGGWQCPFTLAGGVDLTVFTGSQLGAISGVPYSDGGATPFAHKVSALDIHTAGGAEWGAYAQGSKKRVLTLALPYSAGNVSGGISSITVKTKASAAVFQYQFTPPIPKDNTKSMTLAFEYSWDRA